MTVENTILNGKGHSGCRVCKNQRRRVNKEYVPVPFVERFWASVNKAPGQGPTGDCWLWQGAVNKQGYGVTTRNNRYSRAHRIAYELSKGQAPGPLLVCHTCDNPTCVNPAHLFLGTTLANAQDRSSKGRSVGQSQTHCFRGHEYNAQNTYYSVKGFRLCRLCHAAHRAKNSEQRNARRRAKRRQDKVTA